MNLATTELLRCRLLLLPWDFYTKYGIKQQPDGVAFSIYHSILAGAGAWPGWTTEVTAPCLDICYFCKRPTPGFCAVCTDCKPEFEALSPAQKSDYLFHQYYHAFRFATRRYIA